MMATLCSKMLTCMRLYLSLSICWYKFTWASTDSGTPASWRPFTILFMADMVIEKAAVPCCIDRKFSTISTPFSSFVQGREIGMMSASNSMDEYFEEAVGRWGGKRINIKSLRYLGSSFLGIRFQLSSAVKQLSSPAVSRDHSNSRSEEMKISKHRDSVTVCYAALNTGGTPGTRLRNRL